MKKETKKSTLKHTAAEPVLEFSPECFIDRLQETELLDGQAQKLLKEDALETDAKSEFKTKRTLLKKALAKQASGKDGLALPSIYTLRLQYMAYQLRIADGSNTRAWTIKGAQMVFDSVIASALCRTAAMVDDTTAAEWDSQLIELNEKHQIILSPQKREHGQYVPVLMVSLSEPEIEADDLGIFGEEYPEDTESAWMFRG